MDKAQLRTVALAAKAEKGVSWKVLSSSLGRSETWIASCVYGENSMDVESADKLCETLGLGADAKAALMDFPLKGQSLGQLVPTDPLIYRFYEIMQVYGMAVKDVVHEEFGDGIMSAIDFKIDVEREENPKGDRVVVTMNGKFLPYVKW